MHLATDLQIHEIHQIAFFVENGLLPNEAANVNKKIRSLAQSTNPTILRSLALALGNKVFLPKDIALKLLRKNIEIAQHVLVNYPKFDANDLIGIIEASNDPNSRMGVIAQRKHIQPQVIDYICEHAPVEVIIKLYNNQKLHFTPAVISRIINKHHGNSGIIKLIGPKEPGTMEMLPGLNEQAKVIIYDKLGIEPTQTALSLLDLEAVSKLNYGKSQFEIDLKSTIDSLYAQNKLSYNIMLRFLSKGDLYSFTYSVSKHSDTNFLIVRDNIFAHNFADITDTFNSIGSPKKITDAALVLLNIIIDGVKRKELDKDNFAPYINQKLFELKLNAIPEIKFLISLIGKTPVQKTLDLL